MLKRGRPHLVRTIEQLEVLPHPVQAELNALAAAGAERGERLVRGHEAGR